MKFRFNIRLIPLLAMLTLPACTWVTLSDDGKSVRLLTENEAADCKKIGTAQSQVKSVVAGVERSQDKMREELAALARNAAADIGGNAIAASSAIEAGIQHFFVYKCPE